MKNKKTDNLCNFALQKKIKYRPGCGYGLQQAHLIIDLHWRPGNLNGLHQFASLFQPMCDEVLTTVPASMSLDSCVKWLAITLGTVLRNFKIATFRDVQLRLISPASDDVQVCQLALPSSQPKASLLGLQWLLHMLNEPPRNQAQAEAAFLGLQKKIQPYVTRSANQWRTLQAAYDIGYAVSPFMGSTVCIGTGFHRRLFTSFVTDQTPMQSMLVSQNKFQTAQLLRAHGLPGAQNKLVTSMAEVLAEAKVMGYPLVIKPNDKDRGEGVAADLIHESDLILAYESASKCSQQVLLEKHQAGFTHRFTVVKDKVMRVAKHVAFGVVGNGHSSIEELVADNAMSLEERKRVWRNFSGNLALDEEALSLVSQLGLTKESIPAHGQYVKLRRKDNVSAGGKRVTLDMAQEVHPDNIQLALNAVRLIGLDFAGVDLISPDVGRSWREMAVTICEINGSPQLVARDDPEMYKRVLAHVMPKPARVMANLVVFVDPPTAAELSRLVQTFSPSDKFAGLSMASGLWMNGLFCAGPFANGYSAGLSLIVNSQAQQITCVMTVNELLSYGLPMGQVDHLFLPWRSIDQVPTPLKKDYQELLRMVLPHAEKTLYAKGT